MVAEYGYVSCAGTFSPSTEPILMIRAGSSHDVSLPGVLTAAASSRGSSFWVSVKTRCRFRVRTFAKASSGKEEMESPQVARRTCKLPQLLSEAFLSPSLTAGVVDEDMQFFDIERNSQGPQ